MDEFDRLEAIADRKYWLGLLPTRWHLSGFNYRYSASVYKTGPEGQRKGAIELTAAHLELFKAMEDEGITIC